MKLYATTVSAIQITDATFDNPPPHPDYLCGWTYDPVRRIASLNDTTSPTVRPKSYQNWKIAGVGDWIIKRGDHWSVMDDVSFRSNYTELSKFIREEI